LSAGHRQDQADLHAVLGARRRQEKHTRNRGAERSLRQHCGTNKHQRILSSIGLKEPCPRPLPHHSPDFPPCSGAAWRPFGAPLSIATISSSGRLPETFEVEVPRIIATPS